MNRCGFHLGNWGDSPAPAAQDVIAQCEPNALLAMENIQPGSILAWAEQPYARYLVLRKHFAADGLATGAQMMDWINGFAEMIGNYLTHAPIRAIYDAGGLGAKLWNEPNMPDANEGFGHSEDAMRQYNDLFPQAAQFLKDRFPKVKIIGYSMTPGNRDVWFDTAPEGIHYWLHGPEAAKPNATFDEKEQARFSCLTKDAQAAMDWFGCHIYTEWLSHWNAPFLGLRFQRMWQFLPQRLVNNTFVLEMSIADNPTDIYPDGMTEQDRQITRAEGINRWIRKVRSDFPQIKATTAWWLRDGDPTWEKHFYTNPDGTWRPCADVVKAFNLEAGSEPQPDPDPEPPPEPSPDRTLINVPDWITFDWHDAQPGETYWKLTRFEYVPDDGGLHHIFSVEPHDPAVETVIHNTVTGETFPVPHDKPETEPAMNFPMSGDGNTYSARCRDDVTAASDAVAGMTMPQNQHESYYLTWQRVTAPDEEEPVSFPADSALVDRIVPAHPSNYDDRPADAGIDAVVLHATGVAGRIDEEMLQGTLAWFANPDANVSAHYVIAGSYRLGEDHVFQCVPEAKRAWHAGESQMPDGRTDANDFSIGIELVNQNTGDDSYSDVQMNRLRKLLSDIVTRHDIPRENVVTHAEIAVPAGRKSDPANFPLGEILDALYGAAPAPSLADALRDRAADEQLISPNPDAALQKAAVADGLMLLSNEWTHEHAGTIYVAQLAADIEDGSEYIFYVEVGDWGNVQRMER